ncbi:RNA-binding S4 domain-containing protein [Pelagibius sp. Alg239-R121]|uniref:RNA-binding S4 domain-containing protein n=1 Tax=Pelagibius sp. Alg239-R121 TaxID=2993448 RepID=UPI0024A72B36|nr:RNA-binding S4 domain-containing protein [Pelagibius sp. Alg239-R121]
MVRSQNDRGGTASDETEALRIDKWLWFARFFKSRSLASQFCGAGRVRIAGNIVGKASHMVRVEDILTFPLRDRVRVIKIVALGSRRGPAREAVLLYEDLSPETVKPTGDSDSTAGVAEREPGSGRPTKRERRHLDRLREN